MKPIKYKFLIIPIIFGLIIYSIKWYSQKEQEKFLNEYKQKNDEISNRKSYKFKYEPLKPIKFDTIKPLRIEPIKPLNSDSIISQIDPFLAKWGKYKTKAEDKNNAETDTILSDPLEGIDLPDIFSDDQMNTDPNDTTNNPVEDEFAKYIVNRPTSRQFNTDINEWESIKITGIGFVRIPPAFEVLYDRVKNSNESRLELEYNNINDNKIRIQSKEVNEFGPPLLIFIGKQSSSGLNQDIFTYDEKIQNELVSLNIELKDIFSELNTKNGYDLLNWADAEYVEVNHMYSIKTSAILKSRFNDNTQKWICYKYFGKNHMYYFETYYELRKSKEYDALINAMLSSFEIIAEK